MVFVDSNIWCYYFDKSAKEHEKVSKKLNELLDSKKDIHINTVVLMEVANFLVKNLRENSKEKIEKMLQYDFKITDLEYSLTKNSLEILEEEHQTGIGGRDATIIASMEQENVKELVTHDQAFKRIKNIEVSDPIG